MTAHQHHQLSNEIRSFLRFCNLGHNREIIFTSREQPGEVLLNGYHNPWTKNIYINGYFLERTDLEFVKFAVFTELLKVFAPQATGGGTTEMHPYFRETMPRFEEIGYGLTAVKFWKQRYGPFSFKDYVAILYKGGGVLNDIVMRLSDFERHLGTLLSIKHFLETGHTQFYWPKLHLDYCVIHYATGKGTGELAIRFSSGERQCLKNLFQNPKSLPLEVYLNTTSLDLDKIVDRIDAYP